MFPVDADPRFARFGLRTECARCGAHLPVNGPVDEVGCADCGHHMKVPDDMWMDRFRMFEREFPEPIEAGTVIRGDNTWRWTCEAVAAPVCTSCGGALDGEADEVVSCPDCGTGHAVAEIPEPLRRKVLTAARVFGADDDLTRPEVHREPVVLACPQCGGGLSIGQERERITPCDFCDAKVHLPDAVWRQLHPPREVVQWTVRFEGEGTAAARARRAQEKAAKKAKAKAERDAKQAAKAEQREAAEAARAEKQRKKDEKKAASSARRARLGGVAVVLSTLLDLAACGVMGLTIGIYFVPNLHGMLGIRASTLAMANTGMLAVGGATFLGAWLVGHVAVAWRSELPVFRTVVGSSLFLVMSLVPPIGLFGGPMFGFLYLFGRFPTPWGEEYKRFKHPMGVTWGLALLMAVGGIFATVAEAQLLGMSIGEMIENLPED